MEWKKLSSAYISDHIYFTARKDRCERPDGKIVDPYFVVELPPCVCAVALTVDNELIMVEQFRYPVGETLLEIPGGFIDKGEDPEAAVARELMEETGYSFENYEFLGKLAANPGVLDNYTHFFLARGGKKIAEQQLDKNEDIRIRLVPLEEAKQLLKDNRIKQALHAAAMFYAFQRI